MRIAVLGLGLMGSAFARRVELAGHELFVWNRSPGPADEFAARGATVLASPAEALARTELALTSLADPAAVEAVVCGAGGILEGATGGTLVEMSTIDAVSSAAIAERAHAAGVEYLRAPVSGNAGVVAAGNLAIVVSGSRAAFDALSPTLAEIGPNLFWVGEA